MTTIKNQVACSLCIIKTVELKRMYHLFPANHLKLCKNDKEKIAIKLFEMNFHTYCKKSEVYSLKIKKTLFSGSYFLQQSYQKKILIYYAATQSIIQNKRTELLNFIQNATHDIGESYFETPDKITFCKNCIIEINKTFLYDQMNSKKHKDIEE